MSKDHFQRKWILTMKIYLSLCQWVTAAILLFVSNTGFSCTSVFANDKGPNFVVARTMDLFVSDNPLILSQPRGLSRTGEAGKKSLSWTSKYGSLVVTAFHTKTVSDGINEKMLVAHLLYLTGSEYPKVNANTPKVSNTLWAQYVLDNYATVNEVVKNIDTLHLVATKVKGRTWPIHLAVQDKTGDAAVIEFIDGKAKVYHGKQYQVMTNEPAYNIQLDNLKKYKFFGGQLPLPGDTDPLSRFVRVSTYLKTLPKTRSSLQATAGIFSVIRSAMVPFGAEDTSGNKTEDAWPTRWVTVADLKNGYYYFNSTMAPNIVWFNLKDINFSKKAPILSLDPTNTYLEGNVTKKLKAA